MGKATLHTVAAHSGVSIATVSKVINGVVYGISAETMQKVQKSIQELGYRPNLVGRGLRTMRRSIIGMAIIDPSPMFLADPFTTNLVAGLSNYLSERDYGLLLHGLKPKQLDDSFLVRESAVDGLCVMMSGSSSGRQKHLSLLAGLRQPIIVFQDRPHSHSIPDTCFVNQNDYDGAKRLAEHVTMRKIQHALIVIPDVIWPAVSQRVRAYSEILQQRQIKNRIIRCNETELHSVSTKLSDYIRKNGLPELIMGANDRLAYEVSQFLNSNGVQVPGQVAISGFNAFNTSSHFNHQLTSARSPAYELGKIGGKLILERLKNGSFQDSEITLPVELIKGSTA